MGAGVRQKKVAFIGVKVYAVSVYVEADKAAREIGVRERGGFFDDNRDDDYCLAIADGAFSKLLHIALVRKVEGAQFYEALQEALEPRLRLMGEMSALTEFQQFLAGRVLDKGTHILLLWRSEGALEVVIRDGATPSTDYSKATPDLRITSPSLCRALFEVYLGSASVVPDAKRTWALGMRALLDSENVRRNTRPGGSG